MYTVYGGFAKQFLCHKQNTISVHIYHSSDKYIFICHKNTAAIHVDINTIQEQQLLYMNYFT